MLQNQFLLEDKKEKGKRRKVVPFVVVYQTKVALDTISGSFECLLAIKRTIINTNNLNETMQDYRLSLLYTCKWLFLSENRVKGWCISTFGKKLVLVKKIDAFANTPVFFKTK